MSEKSEFLVACLDYHLGRGKEPREAWGLAVEDYAFVYGPQADPERLKVSLAAEAVLKHERENEEAVIERGRV